MDNILKYLIQLKADEGNVRQVARQTLNDLNKIEDSAKNIGSSLRNAFSLKNFGDSLKSIPGMQFLMNPYTIIGAGIGAITKLGSEAEMTSVAFTKLVGDETKAASVLKEIKDYSNATPYESMDLIESAKQMMSFGVSTEKTVDTLKRLGDISMGDKNRLSSLSLVFSQVASAGKLQGQDFLQFVNAGFNPLQELSQMTGKTMGELKDMMSNGQIGAEAVSAAISHATNEGGKFFGMSEQLAGTTSGKFSTLIGKLKESAASAYQSIQPIVNAFIDFGIWLSDNMGLVASFAAVIGTVAIAANAASIGIGIYKAVVSAVTIAQTALNAVMSISPLGWLAIAIGAVTTAIAYCWKHFAGFRAFLVTTWGVIKKVGDAITQLFSGNIAGAFKTVSNAFKNFGTDLGKNYKTESAKQSTPNKISTPRQSGSIDMSNIFLDPETKTNKKKGAKSKTASEIATGGTRNTQITINLGKFFDNLQVTMMDKMDTNELQTVVVQSLNRALAIATSTDR